MKVVGEGVEVVKDGFASNWRGKAGRATKASTWRRNHWEDVGEGLEGKEWGRRWRWAKNVSRQTVSIGGR